MTSPYRAAKIAEQLSRIRQEHRSPKRVRGSAALSTWELRLAIRRASLRRVIECRKLHRMDTGDGPGWVSVILNLLHCEGGGTDLGSVNRAARKLGLPAFDGGALGVVAGGIFGRRLMPAAQCGALIGLTTLEREELEIQDIDAADEPAPDRKRRKQRERQRKRRATASAVKPPSIRQQQPWLALGIAERTYWRRKAKGLVA